ncbi:MAG: BlaI/MecI/CopY family transcriptional regulator [Oscillibacter sp.]|nr:BlaI/MecI/CopY family transcriptional regulator [Oscillibacter sp.]
MAHTPTSLSPSEWQVMEALWARPQTLMELSRTLAQSAGWSKSTVSTMLRRMEEKGLVTYDQAGRTKTFRSAVERDDVVAAETESLLRRAYHGSVGLLVNTLVGRSRLSSAEIAQLYALLQKAEEDAP